MTTELDRGGMAKGLFTGMFIGGVAGAAVALLYAPTSGRELRSSLRGKTDKLLSDAEEILEKAKTHTSETIHNGRKQLTDDAQRLKEAVKAGVEAYKE